MKAALNGALNFSVLDGWWREAYNGGNGWSIGEDRDLGSPSVQDEEDVDSLYETLEKSIIPLYYERDQNDISQEWVSRIKESLKTNIPRFSTRRMVKEYVERLYIEALN
jgi:starch phosphorylase